MVTLRLDDPKLVENFEALQNVMRLGIFTDSELQDAYDRQLEKDKLAQEEADHGDIETR